MFTLVHQCQNCNHLLPAKTVDGCVVPPPDFCPMCSNIETPTTKRSNARSPGDVFGGLQLDHKSGKYWRCLCLFCKEYCTMGYNNIGNHNGAATSCGCLKSNPLKVNYFHADRLAVNVTCRKCGLEADYDLDSGEVVECLSGCKRGD